MYIYILFLFCCEKELFRIIKYKVVVKSGSEERSTKVEMIITGLVESRIKAQQSELLPIPANGMVGSKQISIVYSLDATIFFYSLLS